MIIDLVFCQRFTHPQTFKPKICSWRLNKFTKQGNSNYNMSIYQNEQMSCKKAKGKFFYSQNYIIWIYFQDIVILLSSMHVQGSLNSLVYSKTFFLSFKYFIQGYSKWLQIKQSGSGLNRIQSSNFLWLRSANYEKIYSRICDIYGEAYFN